MAAFFTMWMCLHASEVAYAKVITINNNGSGNYNCCVEGLCMCNSIYSALDTIKSNTMINITSKVISLSEITYMGAGNMHNITITGNGATIMCNNSGGVHCVRCCSLIIEGITWDQCGNSSKPNDPGLAFDYNTDLLITNCVVQWFKVCRAIRIHEPIGNISIIDSVIHHNSMENVLLCHYYYSNIHINNTSGSIKLTVSGSVFNHNGHSSQPFPEDIINASIIYYSEQKASFFDILIENTNFSSNGVPGMFLNDNAINSFITVVNVTLFNNTNGGLLISAPLGDNLQLDILSSDFSYNTKRALNLELNKQFGISCIINNTNFVGNKGAKYGVALYFEAITKITDIRLSDCKFDSNTGKSILYAVLNVAFINIQCNISVTSCNFTRNRMGSALHLSQSFLHFYNSNLLESNSAESGAAIYFEKNSQVAVDKDATVQFIDNTAVVYGGAIYADLEHCLNHGILFSDVSDYNSVTFVNNSAGVSGNSIYFNIPASCDVVRDETSNDSVVHIPYNFTYTQHRDTIGPAVATSPYAIKLCSPADCSVTNNERSTCLIEGNKMLGQSIDFNATVCDYYNANAEAVQFQIKCENCDAKFQLLKREIFAFNGSNNQFSIVATNAAHDITDPVNITLNISSVLSHEYKQFTATLSLTLSSCYNGFVFDNTSQRCQCYRYEKDIVQCLEDRADINQGYWFGVNSDVRTISVCPNFYCNFVHRKETRTSYFILPELLNDQCSPHRRGPACGECSPGCSLSYDTPDCVSNDKCSTEITVLVVVLTILYWIALIAIALAVMYHFSSRKVLLGCIFGLIYFYSIVDIVLVDKLYISDGVFYTVTGLSSFAKLTPQFLGKLCFVKELDAIDQQFIHYFHVLCVWFIFAVILIVARYCNTVARYINRSIALVTGLLLLLSYTTVASTSLQLLRALQYNDVDEVYVYLSPQMKYFTGRHAVYGSVALVCGLVIVLGLPVLLVVEPFLKKKNITIKKVTPLLDRFQDCYTDKYSWFAAYYLICRLVIMLIVYFANSDYSNMIYYLQTACVIITMTHILVQPYEEDNNYWLNMMDTVILLSLSLIVNLNSFNFTQSVESGITVALVLFPFCLILAIGIYFLLLHRKVKPDESNHNPSIKLAIMCVCVLVYIHNKNC